MLETAMECGGSGREVEPRMTRPLAVPSVFLAVQSYGPKSESGSARRRVRTERERSRPTRVVRSLGERRKTIFVGDSDHKSFGIIISSSITSNSSWLKQK